MAFLKLLLAVWLCIVMQQVTVDAGVCGNEGQCRCTLSGEVICTGVLAAPFFMLPQRYGKRLTLKTTRDFDASTLKDVAGFDRVMIIGMTESQCSMIMSKYPGVMCVQETTSYRQQPGARMRSTNSPTTSDRSDTSETLTSEETRRTRGMATTVSQKEKGDKGYASKAKLNAMIGWNVVSGICGFVSSICVLVSLVNLHERINAYTACNDEPRFAVTCCLNIITVIMLPCYICTVYCSSCPGWCVHLMSAMNRRRQGVVNP